MPGTLSAWTDKLPPDKRDEADKILADEAAAGMGLRDLAELAAEILARCRPDEPDEDPGKNFEDRSVEVQTTFQGPGSSTATSPPNAPRWSSPCWTR